MNFATRDHHWIKMKISSLSSNNTSNFNITATRGAEQSFSKKVFSIQQMTLAIDVTESIHSVADSLLFL